MRPLKLIMNAFGPYKDKVEIDFTQFSQASLFLVSGPTGSGKTTIFDAIAYALFDGGSGDARDKDTFKSDFSKDTDLCYVELEFEIGKDRYFIHREPTQTGPGTRTKTKQIQSNIEFHHNGKVTAKVTEANAEIQELIGLTYDQFRQIVMLPQGAFKKMLEANSREKETVFRNIFQTDIFQSVQIRLKEQTSALSKKREDYASAMGHAFARIETEGLEKLEKAIEQFDTETVLIELDELIQKEEKELKEIRESLTHLQAEETKQIRFIEVLDRKEALDKEKVELDRRAGTVKAYEEKLHVNEGARKLNEAEKEIKTTIKEKEEKEDRLFQLVETEKDSSKRLKQLKEEYEVIEEEVKKFDETRTAIQTLRDEQRRMADLKEKTLIRNKIVKEKQAISLTMKQLKESLDELSKKINDSQKQLEILNAIKNDLPNQLKKINTQKEEWTILLQRSEKLSELCLLRESGAKLKEEFSKVNTELSQIRDEWQTAKTRYYSNLAVVLAGELKDEQACPVCGSTEHPEKAHAATADVSKEKVDKLEVKKNQVENTYNQLGLRLEHVSNEVAQLSDALKIEAVQAFEEHVTTKEALDKQEGHIRRLEEEWAANEKQVEMEADFKKMLENNQKEERESSLSLERQASQVEQLDKRIEEVKAEEIMLKESLHYETAEEITQEIRRHEQFIKEVENKTSDNQKETSQAQSALASTLKAIELTQEQIEGLNEKEVNQKEGFSQLMATSKLDADFETHILTDEQVREMQGAVSEYKENRAVHTSRMDDAKDFLEKEKEIKEKAEYIHRLDTIQGLLPEKEETRDRLIQITSQNQEAMASIRSFQAASSQIEENYQIYGELSRMASGAKETDYVSFERYVLGIYFEEILQAANARFTQMTHGRYELHRKIEKAKGGGPQGLDINVFDHYTGKVRGVNTLSGGETFKASLALALGLSDVIQSQSGGVRVDTLFVDEGFGTLDSDSLDMAIQTLLDLHKRGRMIGIISHVDELKTRIPSHIVVEKTSAGSRAYVQH